MEGACKELESKFGTIFLNIYYMLNFEISNTVAGDGHRSHAVLIILFLHFKYVFLVIQQIQVLHCERSPKFASI